MDIVYKTNIRLKRAGILAPKEKHNDEFFDFCFYLTYTRLEEVEPSNLGMPNGTGQRTPTKACFF